MYFSSLSRGLSLFVQSPLPCHLSHHISNLKYKYNCNEFLSSNQPIIYFQKKRIFLNLTIFNQNICVSLPGEKYSDLFSPFSRFLIYAKRIALLYSHSLSSSVVQIYIFPLSVDFLQETLFYISHFKQIMGPLSIF